jgi:hypothetical protein
MWFCAKTTGHPRTGVPTFLLKKRNFPLHYIGDCGTIYVKLGDSALYYEKQPPSVRSEPLETVMFDYTLALAGLRIGVSSQFERTKEFCADYLTEGEPDFTVSVYPEDIRAEHFKSLEEAELEGYEFQKIPPPFLEPLAVYRKIADRMPEFDTILFHGSAISVDGEGYLFTALSGTGKSTHTRLWREHFGDRAVMVNDDKPLLRIEEDRVLVCGSPWNGKHRLGTNTVVPLKGLCVLTRSEENYIEPLSVAEAFPLPLQQTHRPKYPMAMGKILALLHKLTQRTGLYRLGCNMNPHAALVAYEGMNGKEQKQ